MLHVPEKLKDAQNDASEDSASQDQKDAAQLYDGQLVTVHLVEGFAGDVVLLPPLILHLVQLPLLAQLENGHAEVGSVVGTWQ